MSISEKKPQAAPNIIPADDAIYDNSESGLESTNVQDAIDEIVASPVVDTDEKVKYDVNDPTAGYLSDKVAAGDGVSVAEGTGADENKIVITNTDKGSDVDLSGKLDVTAKAASSDINTGTDNDKYITSDALAGSNTGKRIVQLKIFDDATAVATGDGKLVFMVPVELNGMNLVDIEIYVSTVSSSGTPTVQVRNVTDSVDMLSTVATIDANEYTSLTAATPPVIDTTKDDVATGDLIAIDVDVAGTGAKGLGVQLSFQLP